MTRGECYGARLPNKRHKGGKLSEKCLGAVAAPVGSTSTDPADDLGSVKNVRQQIWPYVANLLSLKIWPYVEELWWYNGANSDGQDGNPGESHASHGEASSCH